MTNRNDSPGPFIPDESSDPSSHDPNKAVEIFGKPADGGIQALEQLEKSQRIVRYQTILATPEETCFAIDPNLIPTPLLAVAHGPQILQTITQAIDELHLHGQNVKLVRNISFRKPITKNNIILFSTNPERVPKDAYCYGELDTNRGPIFFGVIDYPGINPRPLQGPLMIPIFFAGTSRKGQNTLTQNFFISTAPIVRTAMVSEDVLTSALMLLDNIPGLGLKHFPLRVLTKITALALENINADGEYSITAELVEAPVHKPNAQNPEKIFCNMNYSIFNKSGRYSQGLISVALLRNRFIG